MMVPATADPAVVQRVLTETRVETTLPPTPWMGYVEAVAEAIARLVAGIVAPVGAALGGYAWIASVIAVVLIVVIGLWLILMVVRLAQERRRQRDPSHVMSATPTTTALPAHRDAHAWRAELERRLDEGQVGPALEALWWWFACRAAGTSDVEWSCTSRELVRRAGRAELAGPAGELDRWLYGPRRPGVSELRGLLRRAEQVVS